jgi:hypothetical protein
MQREAGELAKRRNSKTERGSCGRLERADGKRVDALAEPICRQLRRDYRKSPMYPSAPIVFNYREQTLKFAQEVETPRWKHYSNAARL